MKSLFHPAIVLLNRVSYTRKFAIMGVLALVAISVLLISLYQRLHQVIESSRQELVGIEAIKPITTTVRHLQIHRGLSSGVLNGKEEMKEKRAAKEAEISAALQTVESKLPNFVTHPAWSKVKEEWATVQKEGLEWLARENFIAHNRLIDDVFHFQALVADEHGLTNDPDIDSTYLIFAAIHNLPSAIENMGQLRALGTGVLTRKTPLLMIQQVEFSTLLERLNLAVNEVRTDLEKCAHYNPRLGNSFQTATKDLTEAAGKVTAVVNQDIISGVFATEVDAYFSLTTASIEKGYKELSDVLLPTLQDLLQKRIDEAQRNLTVGITVSVLVLALYAYISVALYYATLSSVGELAEQARTLATGDLTVHVDLQTQDELKRVANSLNGMVDAFRTVVKNVHQSASQVFDATQSLSASAGTIAGGSDQQRHAAVSMAAAIEQMSSNINHLASNAQEAHRMSTHAGNLATSGCQVVGQVVEEIQRIAEVVNRSSAIILKLGAHSEAISAIVAVIKEIADQTNLLALNAAIEAARAGESGRGFAVVADEVRKLAERTSRSTQEISTMIAAIQNGTHEAVASMKLGVDCVAEGVSLATRAGESIQEIGSNAMRVVEQVAGISGALGEQGATSAEIARNVESVARMAEENCTAAADNATTAERLQTLSGVLEQEVRRFRLA
ncbi:MAG TPA: methyl-accepting chemotaxis protein [Accumulibacter sp.]|nr:methyl-accepting chemotaxis protein [Accumulibacter sp.]HMW18144.1 methyl-accepting chemotaxis protein [Accumulibacter sp.]HNC18228.1 methyl-accepting chemotaxis protein [Accumulibacter sp.]HNE11899.1 methyl-accepting chemotaxis protein [Accumulibacter sp.]HNI72128.1 methyl-accepting chemotaxis protein [Accumulibacter sp.]